jgi:hypothetical protein
VQGPIFPALPHAKQQTPHQHIQAPVRPIHPSSSEAKVFAFDFCIHSPISRPSVAIYRSITSVGTATMFGKRSSSARAGRLMSFWLGVVLVVVAPSSFRETAAYVTVETPSTPTGAPTVLEGEPYGNGGEAAAAAAATTPTSAPTILEVPDSFTKEPAKGVLDDDFVVDDDKNNSSSTNTNSNNTSENSGGVAGVFPPPGPSPSTATDSTAASSKGGSGLSTGAIVGIVVGAGTAVGLLLFLAFVLVRRRGKKTEERRASSGSGQLLEVKQFSTAPSPNRKKTTSSAGAAATAASSASSKDEEDGSDSPDPTEYSCTVSSSRGSDDALLTVAVSHPSYAQHALRALEEVDEDEADVVLEYEV